MALATADRRNARCFAQVLGVGGVANISAQAMARPTAPHIRGLVFAGNCMASPFRAALRPSGRRARDRAADDQHDGENREQERRYRPAAHAFTSRWAGAQASLSRRRPETWGATVDTATPCVRVCPTGSLSYLEQHPLP